MIRWLTTLLLASLLGGCLFIVRDPVQTGIRVTNDRFEVTRLNRGSLSADQHAAVAEFGKPDTIVFETQLKTGKPVQRWIYTRDKRIVTFLQGNRVDYVQVESEGRNPLLEAQADQGPLIAAWQWLQLAAHWLRR